MKLIDTHTHLYVEEFKNDINAVIERAAEQGVEKFYLPAIDSSENEALLNLEKRFPGKIFAMAGLHPCSVKENFKEELKKIEQQLSEREFAAIGETGLDFYWDTTFSKEQYESLHAHVEWAIEYKKPLVIHTRNAMQETIDLVNEYKGKNLFGIFHCFSGTIENAKEIIEAGFLLGIGGVLTFKNSGLAEVIKDIDLKYLVLETDSPYLAPVPFRGKRNESSYLKYIVEKLAQIKNISVEEAASQTTKNAEEIFSKK
ncbi:MAG TPA: TatD family hydrolase [Hanamia sp.]|jgi:TatD DNase family protein|nr:TatD family hydrolase [Hanamia sp.]